ncbi:amidohydrolase family protein [Rhodococcoides yunnanense]|uniref:Amidohydrolase family protein n=1 Tax=Rhodococcoides yunnanense TaxID=278209 RepID=A0ABU4B6G4_9NOCA|nr:amidohydrolase family protein [Rhodococcus yunnanensis]MDV6259774.1 amidohydrolase family protein [Rhodococcus yunnanensis]
MKFIGLEEHMMPAEIFEAAGANGLDMMEPQYLEGLNDLSDGGDARLVKMDAANVDVQVLSAAAHFVQGLSPAMSVDLSRRLNDKMAAVVKAHPNRFRFFVTLPIADPKAAVVELRRGVEELGAIGTMIHGQTNGVFLDDPSMHPILAEVERLGIPIYLHPGFPPPEVYKAYYSGLDDFVAKMLSTGGWGWHAETGMHILRMVSALVFERFPNLQIVFGHMGENLPFSLARADEWLTPRIKGLSSSVADQVLEHVHITISAYTTVAPLLCAIQVMGADRILFAVDYPWGDSAHTIDFLNNAPISPTDRAKIAYGNAEKLFTRM